MVQYKSTFNNAFMDDICTCRILIGLLLFSCLYQLVLVLETWIIEGSDKAKKVNILSGANTYYCAILGQGLLQEIFGD